VVPPFKQNTREYIICCYDDEGWDIRYMSW
jgi:hypothetical protein